MRKRATAPALVLGLLLPLGGQAVAAAQGELEVAAGSEFLVEQPVLDLQKLRLHDGATLRLAPGIGHLQLKARQAWIGRDVRVLASGSDAAGLPVLAGPQPVAACADGGAGSDGTDGPAGQPGRDLSLELGLMQFGSLLLDTRGGDGAAGQAGSAGAAGGAASNCSGGSGGQGGNGGRGGAGGRGGDVVLRYWSLSDAGHVAVSNFGPGVQILTSGGLGAHGGLAGAGGEGGEGEFTRRGNGVKVYRNGGSPGQAGLAGDEGSDGEDGRFIIQPVSPP